MKLLIDSHAVLWWLTDDPRLSSRADAAIANTRNTVFVSACVGYEIIYKQRSGRLPSLRGALDGRLQRDGFELLPISLGHAIAAAGLAGPHRDPWDRLMMAQALAEDLTVVTIDPVFAAYDIPVLW